MAEKKEKKDKGTLTVQQLKNAINKQYGAGTITRASEAVSMQLTRIPTGSLALDCETGGGYPRGRVTLLAGHESAGKSFLAFMAVAQAQKMYPNDECWWIDYEGSFVGSWAENFGIDLSRLNIVRPNTSEQALNILVVLLGRSDVPLAVLDSLASMAPSAELEGDMEDFTMGLAARQNNKFFRKAQGVMNMGSLEDGDNLKPAFIVINQLRDTMDKYKPETMPGGRGQSFASSITIWVRAGDKYIEKQTDGTELYVGHALKFKTEKNKTFSPKRTGEFDIYVETTKDGTFSPGQVDTLKETITYAVRWDVIKRAGSWFTILDNPEWKFQGGPQVLTFLRENPEIAQQVRSKVMALATAVVKTGTEELTYVTDEGLEIDPGTGEILNDNVFNEIEVGEGGTGGMLMGGGTSE